MKNLNYQFSAFAILLALLSTVAGTQRVKAQAIYKLAAGKETSIQVLGSSNVHDWTMTSPDLESQAAFKLDKDGQLVGLGTLTFSLNAKSLKSEHKSMDERTYKTMKADQYPKVSYKLISAAVTTVQKNKFSIKITGELTIAGTTQTVTMTVTATINPDNSISCTGSEALKLTDYKIDPPSFMLGAMKVKNELTIQFKLLYKN